MDGEPMQLFGATRGDVTTAQLRMATPADEGMWTIGLSIYTVMRAKPMHLYVELVGDQTPDAVLGLVASVIHKCGYLQAETVRVHLWRVHSELLNRGYRSSIYDAGRPPKR